MSTVNFRCCRPELKRVCEVIGWLCIVLDAAGIIVCSFFICHDEKYAYSMSLSFLIMCICHLIGSICLIMATKSHNRFLFGPWVIINFAAIILIIVSFFVWELSYIFFVISLLLWAQSLVGRYIAELYSSDRGITQLV